MNEGDHNFQDKRRSFKFWVDDVVIDTFCPRIGVYGLAVYAYLARRVKHSQTFPSIRRIAKDLGCATSKIQEVLKTLRDEKLISIEARVSHYGDADSNVYTLLDLSHLHGGVSPRDTPVSPRDTPVPLPDTGVYLHETHGVSPGDTEGISLKGSQEKDLKPPLLASLEAPPAVPIPGKLSPEDLVALYNERTPDTTPKVKTLSDGRRKKITAYLKQFPERDFWQQVFDAFHTCRFLREGGETGWRPTFDWLLQKEKDGSTENCVKVFEGVYADHERSRLGHYEQRDNAHIHNFLAQGDPNGVSGPPGLCARHGDARDRV